MLTYVGIIASAYQIIYISLHALILFGSVALSLPAWWKEEREEALPVSRFFSPSRATPLHSGDRSERTTTISPTRNMLFRFIGFKVGHFFSLSLKQIFLHSYGAHKRGLLCIILCPLLMAWADVLFCEHRRYIPTYPQLTKSLCVYV